MTTFNLTTGPDTFTGSGADDTVDGTASTLNAADSLNGGSGHDVLSLFGAGTFNLSTLAQFTGFEEVDVTNITGSPSNLTLRNGSDLTVNIDNQGGGGGIINLADGAVTLNLGGNSYEVHASTGTATINSNGSGAFYLSSGAATINSNGYGFFYLSSGAATITGTAGGNFHLSSGDAILDVSGSAQADFQLSTGTASIHYHGQAASILVSSGKATIDLTGSTGNSGVDLDITTFDHDDIFTGNAGGYSILSLNGAGTLDLSQLHLNGSWRLYLNNGANQIIDLDQGSLSHITSIADFNLNNHLRTAAATLDLSNKPVSGGIDIASTNATGTTFTVNDLNTGLKVIGGIGNDTLVATGFAFTTSQRAAIFAQGSVETITDTSGTYQVPVVSIGDATISEGNSGNKVETFTVTRTGGTAAFDINFATVNGSATTGDGDYTATSGTLHFNEGVNTQTVSVTINGDVRVEGNETFSVNLSGATNGAAIIDGAGLGTITNDDGVIHAPVNDFNGDGKSDILWRSDAGTVATWDMNDGQTISNNYIDTIGPLAWKIAGTGDFNGDGKSDMLWRSSGGSIVTWDMDDGKSIKDNSLGKVPDNWKIAGIGDFNGDAKSDILWRSDAGTVVTWDMNDGQTLSTNNLGVAPNDWKIAGTGDFNGDGKSDILWRSDAGTVVIWNMNDGQTLSTNNLGVAPNDWKIAGTGDFNGDGKSDLLWRSDAGTIVTWDMGDGQTLSTNNLGSVPGNWKIAKTGDYNGDGKSDILWRSDAGTLVIWDMDDGHTISTNNLGIVPNDWHII